MTLAQVYSQTADSYSRPFNEAQLAAWQTALADFAAAEVKRAADEWRANVVPDFDSRPLGARMPTAADLRAIAVSHRREATALNGGFEPCGECYEGWRLVYSGVTTGWDSNLKGPRGFVKRSAIDPKRGAMVRCKCFLAWKAAQGPIDPTGQARRRGRSTN